ncbi:hypothetical protein AX16_004525 [Volvariella volvacea WC 439]|nr:hypothetical protein AX16_004525 [Volvariella volvacea WC 439]
MSSLSKLYQQLEKEFCPPLDSSLLLVLLGELTTDAAGSPITPTKSQLNELRQMLKELAAQAEEIGPQDGVDFTDESCSTPECYYGQTATSSSFDSESSDSSLRSFSTPLGFLQAALPHIPTSRLNDALQRASSDGGSDDVDMWQIVSSVLTQEANREMEERGLDVDEVGQSSSAVSLLETVPPKGVRVQKQKKPKATKIHIVDIRQQNNRAPAHSGPLAPDVWTQVSSLSARLSELLSRDPSFFSSYFHKATYPTSYHALCAALTAICKGKNIPPNAATEHAAVHINLLEILLPTFEDLNSELRARRISDIELCIRATEGKGENALDLAKLLRDLDPEDVADSAQMGIFHQSPTSPTFAKTRSPSSPVSPLGPPPAPPPPNQKHKVKPPASPNDSDAKTDPFAWQSIPVRKRGPEKNPHAAYIPAYNRAHGHVNVKGSGNERGKGGKGDVGELAAHRWQVNESLRKRNEFLREASKMWKKGSSKTRGGEVAAYFAERAREFQELAKQESLNAARVMVHNKREASHDKTVDLHGATAAEAIVIVKEILEQEGASQSKPLKVVTGRGTHSAGQISVLKPAVKKALIEGGWNVGTWEAGLVVRGKSS